MNDHSNVFALSLLAVLTVILIGLIAYAFTYQPQTPREIFTDCIRYSPSSINGTVQPEIVAECSLLANGKQQ